MRVYIDNQLVTFLWRSLTGKLAENLTTQQAFDSMLSLSQSEDIEFLLSEEILAEISKMPNTSNKRKGVESLYQKLKNGKSVIRNSKVTYDDPIATYASTDVLFNHNYTDNDLNAVKKFLSDKGNNNEFDARYIANAMLPENRIDVFLTADKKSIWNHRDEIKDRFGVIVMLPSELLKILNP